MAKTPPVFKCDGNGCSATRTETNHWVLAFTGDETYASRKWNDDSALLDGAKHLCGDTCALKFYADWLSKIRTAPSADSVVHGLGREKYQPVIGRPGLMETKGLPV